MMLIVQGDEPREVAKLRWYGAIELSPLEVPERGLMSG